MTMIKTTWIDLKQNEHFINESGSYNALFIGRGKDNLKEKINFVHTLPNITSNILIKAILFDDSKFDLTGDLVIRKGAKNCDAYLKIDVLMLSSQASARAVPGLEITENDIKGGHGATVGEVHPEQLFYLQSRGLSLEEAQKVIAQGFIADIVDKFEKAPDELQIQLDKMQNV